MIIRVGGDRALRGSGYDSMRMSEDLDYCSVCHRQLLGSGQCLYCTTSEALELRQLTPDQLLPLPPAEAVLTLVELETGQRFELSAARTRIGRDRRHQVVLDDLYVSRHHAFITFEEGQYWVEDLGSKNGTKLNGSHILDREILRAGDMLTVGRTDFRVE